MTEEQFIIQGYVFGQIDLETAIAQLIEQCDYSRALAIQTLQNMKRLDN